MAGHGSLDELLQEAVDRPVVGWDFTWLGDRLSSQPLPWNYAATLVSRARCSRDLLDLGTGGGEFLASLECRPSRTVATEAWPPNIEIAEQRLHPLGITVVAVEPTPDNDRQTSEASTARLPFPNDSFTLIASRHEAYVSSEVARVLAPGGIFLTQQVGRDYGEFYDALGLLRPRGRDWNLKYAVSQLERVGLVIQRSAEASHATTFSDIGAFAWFLKAIPWVVEGFSIEAHRSNLEQLYRTIEEHGPVTIHESAFWLEAASPRDRRH